MRMSVSRWYASFMIGIPGCESAFERKGNPNMIRLVGMLPALLLASACLSSVPKSVRKPEKPQGLKEENNLLKNGTFEDGVSLPWMTVYSGGGAGETQLIDGALCLIVSDKGANNWDAQVRHREMVIQKGHEYWVEFRAWASRRTRIRPKVGMAGPPYSEYWFRELKLTTEPQTFAGKFQMCSKDDGTAEFAFHLGGPLAPGDDEPYTVCIDDLVLADKAFIRPPPEAEMPIPSILVNQLGYLPHRTKLATVQSMEKAPLHWELLQGLTVVASGDTVVHGPDKASMEHLHIVDFSDFQTEGKGYVLRIGEEVSHSFDIDAAIYHQMKYDALAYFYHNRSGVPIEMPYAGDPQWARPAGHTSDRDVACLPGSGCDYSLDVSGGWYDAGDHGKYVVNGGYAAWVMLNQWERNKHMGTTLGDFGDAKLNIPEAGNGVDDILDEARFQVEFLMKMQVPRGEKLEGMVHHKMHDEKWTGIPLAPHEANLTRYLHPPSTAATLNLCAVAAQCGRIWKDIDGQLSSRCIDAAERAWQAALKHPAIYAPRNGPEGGGPYDDTRVSDELYWAAAELYVTTGEEAYKRYLLTKSPHYMEIPSARETDPADAMMSWQDVAALGSITLAMVPNGLDAADVEKIRQNIIKAGEVSLAMIQQEGYRLPYRPINGKEYPWGSNFSIENNMIAMALAYDFTKDAKYLDGVAVGMDYLLGRNPLDQSYVSGYGERPLKNPHHRFWARQAHKDYPPAPAGALSGGPNTGLQDPYIQAAGKAGCAPQTCFVDNIESWSSNEITINWNASFAWILAFLDEQASAN